MTSYPDIPATAGQPGTGDGAPGWLTDLRGQVRRRLRELGATQEDLAWGIGVTPKHVSEVLAGKATGSPQLLARMTGRVGLAITITDSGTPAEPLERPPWRPSRTGQRRQEQETRGAGAS